MFHRAWLLVVIGILRAQAPEPPQCSLERAAQLHRSGDFSGAVREYQACLAGNPRPEVRSNLGAALAGLGRYDEAIEQYRAALAGAPAQIALQLRRNLALAYYKSQRIGEAAAELEPLHAAQPGDLNLGLLLADCRLRLGEHQQAIDILVPLDRANPGQAAIDYVLGMAFLRIGKTQDAQTHIDRILSAGESAEGHFLLGEAVFQSGNYPAALGEFSKAAALKADLPSLQSYYGRALLFTGDPDGAAAAFRKELAIDPNDFDANFHLASILWHRGKIEEARPLLERAAQVRPGSKEAREARLYGFPAEGAAPDSGPSPSSAAPAIAGLDLTHPGRPLVLVFGSYTCPQLRSSAAALKRISDAHKNAVDFRLVYIREAHPTNAADADWQSTVNQREGVALPAAATLDDKRGYAEMCVRKLNLGWPTVVDGMDGPAESAYNAWPSRVYVVGRDGRIAFSSRLGELEFRSADLDAALREIITRRATDARPH